MRGCVSDDEDAKQQTFAGSKKALIRSSETFAVTANVTMFMLKPIILRRMSKTAMELKTIAALRGSCMTAVYRVLESGK